VGDQDPQTVPTPTTTEASHALALQLLNRYGVLLREHVAAENVPGGFSAVYDVLKALEESGRIRRGYFVAGLGATQFALPAAVDLLRQLRTAPPDEKPEFVQLAATDPANPYGSVLRWPDLPVAEEDAETAPRVLTRAAYAEVILRNGQLVAWLRRGNPNLLVFLPGEEPERSQTAAGLAHFLCSRGQERLRPSHGEILDGRGVSSRDSGDALAQDSAGACRPRANSSPRVSSQP
jgi:ATP-dependent Lhr-like helicase